MFFIISFYLSWISMTFRMVSQLYFNHCYSSPENSETPSSARQGEMKWKFVIPVITKELRSDSETSL